MYPTDSELINAFTPLEREFYEWTEDPDSSWAKCVPAHEGGEPGSTAQVVDRWPNVPDVLRQFSVFDEKWLSRSLRRMEQTIYRDEFLEQVYTSDLRENDHICKLRWTTEMRPVLPIFLGEGRFGNTKTGYMLYINPDFLCPTPSNVARLLPGEVELDPIVLAMDIQIPYQGSSRNTFLLDCSGGSSSEEPLSVPMRSASLGDFSDAKPPFVCLQLGTLMRCEEESWKVAKKYVDQPSSTGFFDAWESADTGFGVVVRLDKNNRPTGAVYAIYGYWRIPALDYDREYSEDEACSLIPQKILWQGINSHQEHPRIRRPHPDCESKFFMAKMFDSLQQLKTVGTFEFQVILNYYKDLVSAKVSGPEPHTIIPTEIPSE